jgi:hypothetical protein
LSDGLEPIEPGHLQVHQHQVRTCVTVRLHSHITVGSHRDVMPSSSNASRKMSRMSRCWSITRMRAMGCHRLERPARSSDASSESEPYTLAFSRNLAGLVPEPVGRWRTPSPEHRLSRYRLVGVPIGPCASATLLACRSSGEPRPKMACFVSRLQQDTTRRESARPLCITIGKHGRRETALGGILDAPSASMLQIILDGKLPRASDRRRV